MKQVPLTKGQVAFVDDEDYESVSAYRWHFNSRVGYAVASVGGRKNQRKIYMHRLIMNAPPDVEVDHKSGIRLDNRRENLRFATRIQQRANTLQRKDGRTAFKGVGRRHDKYKAAIRIYGKSVYLGSFDKPWQAAMAYDMKARELFGEFAKPNFPHVYTDEMVIAYWKRASYTARQPGVYFSKHWQKWIADYRINGKRIINRTFATEAEAIAAVQVAIAAHQTPTNQVA